MTIPTLTADELIYDNPFATLTVITNARHVGSLCLVAASLVGTDGLVLLGSPPAW